MIGSLIQNKLICGGLGAVLICTAALAGSRDKYLAAVGPKPLRFQVEVPDFNPAWLLPALDMGDANAASTNSPGASTTTERVVNPNSDRASVNVETNGETIAPEANTTVIETPQETVQTMTDSEPKQTPAGSIAPQTLLRFFTRNGTKEVLVPYDVEFTPPVPARSGASSATYISE